MIINVNARQQKEYTRICHFSVNRPVVLQFYHQKGFQLETH